MARTITVQGKGRVSVRPDRICVSFTVKCTAPEYAAAAEGAEKRLSALRSAVAAAGFDGDTLKSTDLRVVTEYEGKTGEDGVYRNVFCGYSCIHSLKIVFPFDGDRLCALLDAVTMSGSEPEMSVRFTVEDTEAVKASLLRGAAEDARRTAEVLAEASGVRLGALLSVSCGVREHDFSSPMQFCADGMCTAKNRAVPMTFAPEDIEAEEEAAFQWEIE